MARSVRAFVAIVAIGWIGGWLTSGPAATVPAPRPVVVTVPATTPTSAALTTTTTAVPQRTVVRTSRSLVRPRPPVAPPGDVAPCWMWGYKTRARSDECWGPLLAEHDWPVGRMLAILYCESHGNPWVTNGSHANLLQVAGATKGDDETHAGARAHIALAYSVYQRAGGTSPWRQCGG